MSESESKKLSELRVVDLKAELEKRGLDKNGVKKDLFERLQKALEGEGVDPESYSFDITDKKTSKRLSTSSISYQGDESTSTEKVESGMNNKTGGTETEMKSGINSVLTEKEKMKDKEVFAEQNVTEEDTHEKSEHGSETTINLTLDEDENINEENAEQTGGNIEKRKVLDEKTTTSNERLQFQEPSETTTSGTTQQASKKRQDADAGSRSMGSHEEFTQQKKSQSNPRLLWITNVPKNTRANELKQLLSTCGKVVCAKVVVNARFPGSCCFGYISMGSAEDATNVIVKLNNTEFNGQIIKIDKFENIKADNLNPTKKKTAEENKKLQLGDKKDDKAKNSPERQECSEDPGKSVDKGSTRSASRGSPEGRKSMASDRSSRGRGGMSSRERLRDKERPFHRSTSRGTHHANVLTFDKIKEERERQRMRDRERALREDSRRRHEEALRLREMREISRRQRNEAERLEREREKLRIERDKIEREKSELIKLERERQRIEREKLEMEKMELQRSRLRLEEDRRAAKRPVSMIYRREDSFEDRKRSTTERHFDETPRFEAPHSSESMSSKKVSPDKDFKRFFYDKHELFSKKRGREYNSEHTQQSSALNRSDTSVKFDRSQDNEKERNTRDVPSRNAQSNIVIRSKDSRYDERNRSPHFRSIHDRTRHISQGKSDRDHLYSEPNDRWNHQVAPPLKFGSANQKSWINKTGTWRTDPPSSDRWNPGSTTGRSAVQHFSSNSNLSPSCPPPPGINNYSERFDYNKSSGIKKY